MQYLGLQLLAPPPLLLHLLLHLLLGDKEELLQTLG
jgi:hypothetical protein